jgi:hypothetical protein
MCLNERGHNLRIIFHLEISTGMLCDGAGIVQSVQWLATGCTAEGPQFESRYGKDFSSLHVL